MSVIRDANFAYEPAMLEVAHTDVVRVTFDNRRAAGAAGGFAPHTFTIDDPNRPSWWPSLFGHAVNIAVPADSVTGGKFRLPPGRYQFYCTVYDHRQSGMVGTLVID
jgi:plastocyanin